MKISIIKIYEDFKQMLTNANNNNKIYYNKERGDNMKIQKIKKFENGELVVSFEYENTEYYGFKILKNKEKFTIGFIADLLNRYCNGAKNIKYTFIRNPQNTKIMISKKR